MISSSNNPSDEQWLDAMLIVYSLLEAHPASTTCEQFIRSHSGWLTTAFTLFEAKAILTKVYAVEATLASRKLAQFAAGPIVVTTVDFLTALAAMDTADTLGLDLTDQCRLEPWGRLETFFIPESAARYWGGWAANPGVGLELVCKSGGKIVGELRHKAKGSTVRDAVENGLEDMAKSVSKGK